MRCKVGYWRTGLAVQLDEEAHDWLKTQGRALTVQVLPDRRLLLATAPHGAVMRKFYGDTSKNHKAQGFHAEAEVQRPYLDFLAGPNFSLPLFELHELELDYDYARDGLLTVPLGSDHELPWPRTKCSRERLSAAELQEQCYRRMRSFMEAGKATGGAAAMGIPGEVARVMADGWHVALERARAAVHGSMAA